MPERRKDGFGDHIGNYNFKVEIEGVAAGYFKGVDGLSTELEVVEFQDGDDLFLRKRPGRSKFTEPSVSAIGPRTIVLRGLAPSGPQGAALLADWIDRGPGGGGLRKSLTIVAEPTAGGPPIRVTMQAALQDVEPAHASSVTIPALDGSSKDPDYMMVKNTPETTNPVQQRFAPLKPAEFWRPSRTGKEEQYASVSLRADGVRRI